MKRVACFLSIIILCYVVLKVNIFLLLLWKKPGLYGEKQSDFSMEKVSTPENTLFYINQAYLTLQKGENIVYADHFILGQVIPAANIPSDVSTDKSRPDKVKMVFALYDVATGDFKGLEETMGPIWSRGDPKEVLYYHGLDSNKFKML